MQITSEKRNVTSTGVLADMEFSIENGPHMMAILSGLYKSPADAMVREYITNMYDAHVALRAINPLLDTMKPVLSLPSSLTPTLEFRDYGIGMSMDTVRTVFTKYGKSTKNDDNSQVGGFGLGAKTAFCYNDGSNWSVESRFNGEKHIFMSCLGPSGVPTLKHIDSSPCKEHSGVTIKIPVKRGDIEIVRDAALKYVPYFPLPLEVQGDLVLPKRTWAFETPTWRGASNSNTSDVNIVMGNVPYEISVRDFVDYSSDLYQFFNYNSFDIQIGIGELDIVPSRDALKLTDRTKARIMKALEAIKAEIPVLASKLVENSATEYEALTTFRAMRTMSHFDKVCGVIQYKGNDISLSKGITRKRASLADTTFAAYGITSSDRATIDEDVSENVSITDTDKTWLVLNDMPKGGMSVAKALVNDKLVHRTGTGRARRYGHTIGHAVLVTTTKTPAQLSTFFGGYPVERIVKASDFKMLPKAKGGKRVSVENIYRWSTSWQARVLVPDDGVVRYYLPLTQDPNTARYLYGIHHYDQSGAVRKIIEYAKGMGINLGSNGLYGIRTSDVAKFDAALWVNIATATCEAAKTYVTANKEAYARVNRNAGLTNASTALATLIEKKNLASLDALFGKYKTVYGQWATGSNDETSTIIHRNADATENGLYETLVKDIKMPTVAEQDVILFAKYPMLKVVLGIVSGGSYYGSSRDELLLTHAKEIIEYIKGLA